MSSQADRDAARRHAIRVDREAKEARRSFYEKSAERARAIVRCVDLGVRPSRVARDLNVSTPVVSRLVSRFKGPRLMECPECNLPCEGARGLGVHRRVAHGVRGSTVRSSR